MEPENVSVDDVLRHGRGICSGHVPGTTPGQYMELYELRSYVYAIVEYPDGGKIFALGTMWHTSFAT